MTGLQFEAPRAIDDAVAILAKAGGDAKVLAGGTDLIVQMRGGVIAPGLVVDVKQIPETRQVTISDGVMRVGAAVSGAELGANKEAVALWPGVVEALELIGSTQIQGRATLGGNLCNASPAADSVPAMIAANATCVVAGPNGKREVPVADIPAGPGKTTLAPGEFVVEFIFPKRPARSKDAYIRFIPRTEMDIAVVGAGVNLTLDDSGVIADARVALGAIAPTVMSVPDGAAAIIGSKLDDAALAALDKAARAVCKPINDKRGTIEYRIKVAGVLARRAAALAYKRAGS